VAERSDAREALRTAVRRQVDRKVPPSSPESMTHEDIDTNDGRKISKVLNVPLLAGTLIAVAVLGPAAYAWRSYQVKRTATAFLDRADVLEGQEDWEEAAGYLHRYLRLRPDAEDATEVQIRLAKVYDKSAVESESTVEAWRRKARAVDLYYQAIGIATADEQPALRRRLAELLLDLERFASAEKEADRLLATNEDDPEGLRLLALALYGQVQSGASVANPNPSLCVGEALERALEANPGSVELSTRLAHIYRNEVQLLTDEKQALGEAERAELADKVMNDLVAKNSEPQESPEVAEAFLARYRYRSTYNLPGAEEDLTEALEHGPQDWTVLMTAAESASAQARTLQENGAAADEVRPMYDKARGFYERAMEVDPSREQAYLGLGEVYVAQGEAALAVQTWKRGLDHSDERSILLNARLADVLTRHGQLDEAKGHLDVLAGVAEELAPRSSRLQRVARQRFVDFLRAQWHAAKGEYLQAVPLLRRVTTADAGAKAEAAQAFQAWRMLGGIHTVFAERDRAASAFEEAANLQPGMIQARLDAADAWSNAGRPDLAIVHYERALTVARDTKVDDTEIRFRLARARFLGQARLPEAQRAWGSFETALEELKKPERAARLPEAWRLAILEAQYLVATSKEDRADDEALATSDPKLQQAKQLLDQAQKDFSDSTALLQSLVSFYELIGYPKDADRALAEYEKHLEKPGAACLLRSMLLTRRRQYEEARKVLQDGMEQLSAQARPAIEAQLVRVSLDEGQLPRAQKELKALAARRGKSALLTGLVCQLADVALQKNEISVLKQCESDLRELEGGGGTNWRYYRARRLLAEAQTPAQIDAATDEADALQKQIQRARPEWPAGHFLSGLILERQRRYEEAIDAYKEAVRLGERDISVYERLIRLVYLTQRYDEAGEYHSQLQERGVSSPAMDLWEMRIAAVRGQLDRAIEIARQRIESQPDDPWTYIWLGSLLLNSSQKATAEVAEQQRADAEAAFLKAKEKAPKEVRTYHALFDYYVRTNRLEDAETTIGDVEQLAELAPAARAFSVAEMYRRLGKLEEAEKNYRTADEALARQSEKGKPSAEVVASRVAVKKRLAELVAQSGDPEALEKATKIYRQIRELVPGSRSAQRDLAAVLVLGSVGKYDRESEDRFGEAMELLPPTDAETGDSSVNRRLRAMFLSQRGGKENLAEARQIFEQLVANPQEVTDIDHLALAEIYKREAKLHRAEGNAEEAQLALQAARGQFTALVARDKPNASHVLLFIDFLLQNDLKGDSVQWRRKFEEIAADTPELLQRYVDLLLGQGLKDEAQAALKRLDQLATDSAELRGAYVALLLQHGMNDEASASLDKLEALAPDSLGTIALRARWLAAKGETAKIERLVEPFAARLLEEAGEDEEKRAQVCFQIGAVYSAASQSEPAERWYRRGVELAPDRYGAVVVDLAKQGQTTEAIRICNEAAKRDSSPRAAQALTMVLIEGKPSPEDFELAEPTLSQAVEEYKDNPELLFAVANVRIQQDRIDDAIALYEDVLELRPKNVIVLNNLATLLSESPERRDEALRCIDQAIDSGGPQPALLDTKGTILILSGRAQEAVRWLEEAVSGGASDPRFHFHLAVAYDRVGESGKARDSLQRARDGDLMGQILTETDREWLAELERKFG